MPAPTKKNHQSQKKNRGSFRIIAGQWRSRRLTFPAIEGLRPTTDRVRETVFNWLSDYLYGATALDLFAGSGALGFEALSRGAVMLTLVELNDAAAKCLRVNIGLLQGQAELIQGDALVWLSTQTQLNYDLIFLDPPFRTQLLDRSLEMLAAKLRPETLIYLEFEQERSDLLVPESWRLLKNKSAGQVNYRLYSS